MQATTIIRTAMAAVAELHAIQASEPSLALAVQELKTFQAKRFEASYADLVAHPVFGAPTQFFLTELYSPKDFSARDSQFSRIAGTIERIFPAQVVDTAVALAQVHELTESLDHQMAVALAVSRARGPQPTVALFGVSRNANGLAILTPYAESYLAAWRRVGDRHTRQRQLQTVLSLGRQLDQLTRTRGLRMLLKMMRGPASAAGLSDLQRFLESGFDTFSSMKGAAVFLAQIDRRETDFIEMLFSGSQALCASALGFAVPIGASAGGLPSWHGAK